MRSRQCWSTHSLNSTNFGSNVGLARGEAPLDLSQPSLHSFLILPSRGAYIYDRLLWFHFYFRCISYGLHMILWDSLLIPCDFLWDFVWFQIDIMRFPLYFIWSIWNLYTKHAHAPYYLEMQGEDPEKMFQIFSLSYTPLLNKAFGHGGGFPMINNSGDKKVRVWWYGSRRRTSSGH